ncbi:MAG: endonuclease/exonuclease/phosphatase family protein [Bernardetiaceae bacterium]
MEHRTLGLVGYLLHRGWLLLTLLAYAAAYVPPSVFWLAGFLALGIPLLGLGLVLLLVVDLMRGRYRAGGYVLLVIILGWGFWQDHWIGLPTTADNTRNQRGPTTWVVMSHNTDYLRGTESPEELRERLRVHQVDILCLQEFFYAPDVLEVIASAGLVHRATGEVSPRHGYATFSRFPIIESASVVFDRSHNGFLRTDIQLPSGDTLRVFNVHLQSFGLERAASLRQNLRRLKAGMIQQIPQLEELLAQTSRPATLLCGDFNATAYGYIHTRLRWRWQDAFIASGIGWGRSYPSGFPILRIDYQWHDQNLHNFGLHTLTEQTSDHCPLVGHYQIARP